MEVLQRARDLYAQGELRDALEAAQVACERAPRNAEAWWLLARVARHAGLPNASDQAFARAAGLSRRKPLPYRVSEEDFRAALAAAERGLSPDARRRLAATRVEVQPLPAEADIREGVKPDALSRRRRRPEDVLTIYQENVEIRAPDAEGLRALLERTLSRA